MRYRLGSFIPRPGSGAFAHLLDHPDYRGPLTQALEEMLRVRLSRSPSVDEGTPDLMDDVGPTHPDRPWVEAIHGEMHRCEAGGITLRLLACEYEGGPNGFLTLAASAPGLRIQVFPGDSMQIGFAAMREGDTAVRAWPRLLREVCLNGSLVCFREFERHEGIGGIAEAVESFLAPAHYREAVEALRETRTTSVPDPRELLDEGMRIDSRTIRDRIEARFQAGEDKSLYGFMNAITSTARDEDDWRDRLDLEELAGQIAWLRRPTPSRSGSGVLIPA